MARARADAWLVEHGLAEDLHRAGALLMAGAVLRVAASGARTPIAKPGDLVRAGERLELRAGRPHPYVSRGGVKLAAGLDAFGIDPAGKVCADIGLSTGGFTDCLLLRGARRVHGVDVGYGQVALKLRDDPRVVLHERTNARALPDGFFGEPVELLVIDVSFIGLRQLLPPLARFLAEPADVVALVKPQFECDPAFVEPGGVVRSAEGHAAALAAASAAGEAAGLTPVASVESPVQGDAGNREFLLHLRRGTQPG